MNVQSPPKKVISLKNRNEDRMLDFLKLPPPKIDTTIKYNVGKTDGHQLKFGQLDNNTNSPTGEMPPKHLRFSDNLDEDPFNMLSENLFNISDSECSELYQYKKKAPTKQLYRKKKTEIISDHKIDFHMLTPILKEWISSTKVNKETLTKYTYRLGNLIKFLVDNNIQHPTIGHIMTFIKYNVLTLPTGQGDKSNYISSILSFFKWAEENHRYNNITKGLKPAKVLDPISIELIPHQDDNIENVQLLTGEGDLSKNLNLWGQTLGDDNAMKTRYKSVIYSLFAFFNEININNPTSEDITEYYQKYIFIRDNIDVDGSFEIINKFFSWANSLGMYPNIAAEANPEYIPIPQEEIGRVRKELIEEAQNNTRIKMTVTIKEIANAGFPENEAESLINNELIVIKNWIQSLDYSIFNATIKHYALEFAYFLYSNKITTPTEKDIALFYNHLIVNNIIGVSEHMVTIKRFFKWADRQGIYPNITVNVISPYKIHYNCYPPILYPKEKRRHIPNPWVPLIGIK